MKILHIYKNYFPVLGGIENHIKLVCEELAKLPDYQVQVVVTNGGFNTKKEVLNGVEIIKCGRLFETASTPVSLSMYWHLKKLKPDVVHFHFPYPPGELLGLLAYRRSSTRFVLTYHGDVVRQSALMRLYYPIFNKILVRASTIVVSNPNNLRTSEILKRINVQKIKVIPYGIRLEPFRSPQHSQVDTIRAERGDRVVIFVGRLRYYKGVQYLIEAAREVEAKFLIVGDGPQRGELEDLTRRLGVAERVIFLGEVTNQALVNYLHASDVFVLPSIYRSEAFGISMLEAMACTVPVISTELGTGTSYVNIHQKTGLVVPPANSKALAEAISSLLENPATRKSMGEAGHNRVSQEFTQVRMLERLKKVYHS